jgi:hypothetical protein
VFQNQSGEFRFIGPEVRLGQSSFESIEGLSLADSTTIVGALRNAGIIDGRGVRRIGQDTVDDALSNLTLPTAAAGFKTEIRAVIDNHFARNPKFSSFVDKLGLTNLRWIRE